MTAGSAPLPALPPLPMHAGTILLADLIDLYMAHYSGADNSRVQRTAWWRRQVGQVALQDLTDDHVHAALEVFAQQRSRYYAGRDADGQPIYRAKRRELRPATINRYASTLAAIITWSVKRRIAPKGYVHPCRSIERLPEDNEKTRYLSDDERRRLLDACRAASWPRLYLLVLMALTTGARKGELMALRWADVDFERAVALVKTSKNGDPRVLPLVPAVLVELGRFKAGPTVRVFASPRDSDRRYSFEKKFMQALQVAKVKDFSFHCLRHSCASMLAQNGESLFAIGELLGHRQLQVTKRYAHLGTSHKAAMVHRVLGELR